MLEAPKSNGAIRSLAIVTPFYPPHLGGVERYAREFAAAASRLGLSVNVITTDKVAQPSDAIEAERVRVLRLPAHNIPLMGSHFPVALSGWRKAEPLLNCDVVMAHTRFFMTTLLAARIAARRGKRICVLDHGSGPLRTSPRPLAAASMAYERAATASLKHLSARFFGVSRASTDWLREFGIFDAEIVPNGIAARSEMPRRTIDAFDHPVVFFAGRLLVEKGVRELVDAIEILVREGNDVRLRIAGDGPLAGYVARRAKLCDFLTYLGPLSPDRVAAELDHATIYVNPSNYPEGLPTVLLEAGAAGLPVISTPRGGSADIIRDGETGWLISDGSQSQIVNGLRSALIVPSEALRRGAELFRSIQAQYTWPSVVQTFLALASRDAEATA